MRVDALTTALSATNLTTKMKRLITFIFSIALLAGTAVADEQERYFPYPEVPDTMSTLTQRCDYLVSRFWDRCELKKAFSAKQKVAGAFGDYLSFMPYASADTVYTSINKFMKRLEKQPADQAFIMDLVDKACYQDTSEYLSDDLYLAFARPFAANKRNDKALRAEVQKRITVLDNCKLKNKMPVFSYVDRDGVKHRSDESFPQMTVIFFGPADYSNSVIDRARLNADIATSKLLADGVLRIMWITPGQPDEAWRKAAAGYPQEWIVATSDDVESIFDLRSMPMFYVVYGNGRIQAKRVDLDTVLTLINYKI